MTLATPAQMRPHGMAPLRNSKFSLGFISTPLIWPVRKKQEPPTPQAQQPPFAHVTKPQAPQIASPLGTSLKMESASADITKLNLSNSQTDLSLKQADIQNKSTDMKLFQILSLNNRKNKPLGQPMVTVSDDQENETLTEALDYPSGIEPFYSPDIGGSPFGLYDFDSIYSHVDSITSHHLDADLYNDVLLLSSDGVVGPVTLPTEVDELFHGQSDATLPWAANGATVPQSTTWSRGPIPFHSITLISRGSIMGTHEPSTYSRQITDSSSILSETAPHPTDIHLLSTQPWPAPLAASAESLHTPSTTILTPTPVLGLLQTDQKPSLDESTTVHRLPFQSSTQSHGHFSMATEFHLSLSSLSMTERHRQTVTDIVHEKMPLSLSQNRELLQASVAHAMHSRHDTIGPTHLNVEDVTTTATALTSESPKTPNMLRSKNISDSILPSLKSHFTSILSNYLEETHIPTGDLNSNWAMRTGLVTPDSTWKSQIAVPLTSDLSQIYSFTETLTGVNSGQNHYATSDNVTAMTDKFSIPVAPSPNTVSASGKMTTDALSVTSLLTESLETGLMQSVSSIQLSLTSSVSSSGIAPLSHILRTSKPYYSTETSINLPIEIPPSDAYISHLQMSTSRLIEHSKALLRGKGFDRGFSTVLPSPLSPLAVHSGRLSPSTVHIALKGARSTTAQDSGRLSSEASLNGLVTPLSSFSREANKDPPSGMMMNTVVEHAKTAGSVSILHIKATAASQQGLISPEHQSTLEWFPELHAEAPAKAENNTDLSNSKPTELMTDGHSNNHSEGRQCAEDGHTAPDCDSLSSNDNPPSQTESDNHKAAGQVSTTLYPLVADNRSFAYTKMAVSTVPNRVSAEGSSRVPVSATSWNFTDPTEPCPCKVHTHTVCLCGRAALNNVFFRINLVVTGDAERNEADVKKNLTEWLTQTLLEYPVYVNDARVQPDAVSQPKTTSIRFNCQALLVFKMTIDEVDIEERLRNSKISGLEVDASTVNVETLENCPAEEKPSRYRWPKTSPTETAYALCFPYKEQNASRTCIINMNNYTTSWKEPDLTNCTDIDDIKVSEENAAEVAVQLADISTTELSATEVSKVVTKVKELVDVARINATLAGTVLDIISNVMTTSGPAQAAASETALRAVEQLVLKIEFEGPSFNISSKNLAVGLSAVNASEFNGTTFSAFISPNTTDPQVAFAAETQNPLAVVVLPGTLLRNLSAEHIETVSRINFIFFSKTGLFQDDVRNGLSLNSYVVASSVGNLTIRDLRDPVRIEIAHLQQKPGSKRSCVFWDFTVKNGTGGWNSEGCQVSPDSSDNRTVCLCNHLTHFGILMDISGTAAQIDYQNTKVLTFITYIGCGVSAIFSAVTLLTYITFEKLRRDYPAKILMNLSTSLLFLNMVFLLDGWLASFGMEGLCITVAVFMHFFLLTSFTWMGLESIHMYIALVKVFNTYIRRYILKFCLVGWGLPAAIVCTVVAIDRHSYGLEYYGRDDTGQESSKFCWIRSNMVFYVTCVGYFSIIFLMNVAMFIVVMIQICGRNGKRSNRTLREEILRNLRSVISLTFLLGMTWGFALFAWGPVNLAFMYLFSIFNSLQGLFIFVFHCALKENVQKQWRRYLCCAQLRLADNSDWSKTATNNTKKVSSDNLGKSLSSSSFSSSTANWTSKAKATLNPFANYTNSAGTARHAK
ncbi:hypothetical protein ACEWY4_021650 [Coilia grayii]|uniref:Adhesion G-protein coupled receptor G6 n=1 Tax=Coilia grayii TaxID=363190 RepID=A0ABD1J3Q9_9TELE